MVKPIKADDFCKFVGEFEDLEKGALYFCVGSQLIPKYKDDPYTLRTSLFLHRLDENKKVLIKELPVRADPTMFRRVGQQEQAELEKINSDQFIKLE